MILQCKLLLCRQRYSLCCAFLFCLTKKEMVVFKVTNFNPEFIKRLAMGDDEAFGQIKGLPLTERMAIGSAVEALRRTENIVPMSSGMSIYEEKTSSYDEAGVAEAMRLRMEQDKAAREQAEKAREEFIRQQTEMAVNRARGGLPRNDRLPK